MSSADQRRSSTLSVEKLEDRLVPDATSFVTSLYQNLLNRAPDAGGLAACAQTASPEGKTVAEVQPRGNKSTPSARILAEVKTRAGQPYSQATVTADVARLMGTRLFSQVTPYYQITPDDKVALFRVEVTKLPGLDYVGAFFGCLYAGVTAVPAYPVQSPRDHERLNAIAGEA